MGRHRVACGSGSGRRADRLGRGHDDPSRRCSINRSSDRRRDGAKCRGVAPRRRPEPNGRKTSGDVSPRSTTTTNSLAKRDRRVRRKHAGRMRRLLGPAIVILLIAGVVWIETRETDQATVAAPSSERPPGYPPVDKSVSARPLGTPPPAPSTAGPYEFVARQQGDSGPVAWDPCRPIQELDWREKNLWCISCRPGCSGRGRN